MHSVWVDAEQVGVVGGVVKCTHRNPVTDHGQSLVRRGQVKMCAAWSNRRSGNPLTAHRPS